jgi:hypothetical protein
MYQHLTMGAFSICKLYVSTNEEGLTLLVLDGQTTRHILLYAITYYLLHYMAFLVIAVDTMNHHLASVGHNMSLY